MARGSKGRRSHRFHPYLVPFKWEDLEEVDSKKSSKGLDKMEWEDATCSVCMEFPHNAVLLLCSSYDKGCRPYMCGTSYRFSNCLNQFKKAYTKACQGDGMGQDAWSGSAENATKLEVMELTCPLCRGQVKGCTVVEAAREYLNAKKRSCMQDQCSFVGTYKQLRKHVRAEHPAAQPHRVDPVLEQKWRNLEWERDRDDVLSTITSSSPGAMILGDYVIEGGAPHNHNLHYSFLEDDEDDGDEIDTVDLEMSIEDPNFYGVFSLLEAFVSGGNAGFQARLRRLRRNFRTMDEGGDSGAPRITAGAANSATAGAVNDPPVLGGRALGLGRSQRRPRRRNRIGL